MAAALARQITASTAAVNVAPVQLQGDLKLVVSVAPDCVRFSKASSGVQRARMQFSSVLADLSPGPR